MTGRVLGGSEGCRALHATTAGVTHRCSRADVLSTREPEELTPLSASSRLEARVVDSADLRPLRAVSAGVTYRCSKLDALPRKEWEELATLLASSPWEVCVLVDDLGRLLVKAAVNGAKRPPRKDLKEPNLPREPVDGFAPADCRDAALPNALRAIATGETHRLSSRDVLSSREPDDEPVLPLASLRAEEEEADE